MRTHVEWAPFTHKRTVEKEFYFRFCFFGWLKEKLDSKFWRWDWMSMQRHKEYVQRTRTNEIGGKKQRRMKRSLTWKGVRKKEQKKKDFFLHSTKKCLQMETWKTRNKRKLNFWRNWKFTFFFVKLFFGHSRQNNNFRTTKREWKFLSRCQIKCRNI